MQVYMVQAGVGGPVKIGVTRRNIKVRLTALRNGSAEELRLLGLFEGGRELESELHRRFAAARLCGEWFKPIPELLELASEGAERARIALAKRPGTPSERETTASLKSSVRQPKAWRDPPEELQRAISVMTEISRLSLLSPFMDEAGREFFRAGVANLADEFALVRQAFESAEAGRGVAAPAAGAESRAP